MILLSLLGCGGSIGRAPDGDDPDDTAAAAPAYCAEATRTPVDDPAWAAGGLSFTPQAVVDAQRGAWFGSFRPVSGTASLLALTLERPFGGVIEVVTSIRVDAGTGEALVGSPDAAMCPPAYELAVDLTISTQDGLLAEAFPATLRAPSVNEPSWAGTIDLADIAGDAAPVRIVPAEWDRTVLAFAAEAHDAVWTGSAEWQASDTPVPDEPTAEERDGDDGTGTAAASGETEGLAGFSAER
jgi:hypothetical protein